MTFRPTGLLAAAAIAMAASACCTAPSAPPSAVPPQATAGPVPSDEPPSIEDPPGPAPEAPAPAQVGHTCPAEYDQPGDPRPPSYDRCQTADDCAPYVASDCACSARLYGAANKRFASCGSLMQLECPTVECPGFQAPEVPIPEVACVSNHCDVRP